MQSLLRRVDGWFRNAHPLVRWLPPAAWYGIIFALTAMPGTDGASTQSMLGGIGLAGLNTAVRIGAHLGVFGLLAVLVSGALQPGLRPRSGRPLVRSRYVAGAIALALALSDEIHQSYVPGRNGRVIDLMWDSVGIGAALWLLGPIARWTSDHRTRPSDG